MAVSHHACRIHTAIRRPIVKRPLSADRCGRKPSLPRPAGLERMPRQQLTITVEPKTFMEQSNE
jgi:hypothetical protein